MRADYFEQSIHTKPKKFVLAIGGSFNPPHAGHVRMLERAHDALVELFGPGSVVACYFAVAYPDHVIEKVGKAWAISDVL